jgi:hypothetical protein
MVNLGNYQPTLLLDCKLNSDHPQVWQMFNCNLPQGDYVLLYSDLLSFDWSGAINEDSVDSAFHNLTSEV